MDLQELLSEIKIQENIIDNHNILFERVKNHTVWDASIKARKTVSYGIPYNYSGMEYPFLKMPDYIDDALNIVNGKIGYISNNCLINYYNDGESKMGFHSDQTDLLYEGTGIAIVSLGNKRTMRFKNKENKEIIHDIDLSPNSLFYMTKEVQKFWLHAILPDIENKSSERISLTFRKLID
ncbi:alpha-ketoglutarate-dependent dioxygenase AlkB [Flavobacterium sharifuzzamanii]|uniref:alpha-ketoglutarate-dependent dioxygenase AlkB n=1 Tax=Flavobacterium sharifuzzamanii TaxID=2211133 RepID=UPI000DAD4AF9|nr:alpha-ketoglutarate-dependent dioxygenase AlkB [Flavobacterium sharifuzzamanii]KAF2083044.1 alpha-ketoglutarate-dependent dioxygenase AlkB [Flavobacterium sharifuzzamanii]